MLMNFLDKSAGFLRNIGTVVKFLLVVAILGGGYYIYHHFKLPEIPPIIEVGAPLVCPADRTARGGLVCYQNCPAGWQSDGTAGCYQPCPAGWPGTETLTHCQHATIYSTVGADTSKSIPNACSGGKTDYAALCYNVPAGWEVTAPGFIGKKCPAGWRDDGTTCWQDLDSYGRGSGYALWHEDKCRAENNGSCEQNGAMWYPTCRPEYDAAGCCICSRAPKTISKEVQSQIGTLPDGCPDGRQLIGRLCYPGCSAGYERRGDNLEYCSSVCPAGFTNIGIGGCQKPRRNVDGKGLTEVGVCPSETPKRKLELCYKS